MLHIFYVLYYRRSARSSVAHGGSTSTCTCEALWDFGKYVKGKNLKVPEGSVDVLLGSVDVAVIKGRVLNLLFIIYVQRLFFISVKMSSPEPKNWIKS